MSPRLSPDRPTPLGPVTKRLLRLWQYLDSCVRIDTRSLAAFRVALALIIAVEVLLRARNFSTFYTDDALIPQSLAMENTVDYAVSVYFLTSSSTLIAVLMGLQVVIALQLLVGYRTRTATVLSLLFMVSLDHHNPIVTSYADTLLRMLLFWGIFLPLGERFSVDALRESHSARPFVVGVATVLALGQMVYMYVRNGVHKIESEQWAGEVWLGDIVRGEASLTELSLRAEAAPLILGRDDITFLLGEYTHHLTPVLEVGTILWFYMMLGGFVLLLLRGRWRYPAILLYMGGHASFALTVRIGMFPYVAMAGLLLFVPTQFWRDGDRLLRRVDIHPGRVTDRVAELARGARALPNGHLSPPRMREGVYQFALVFVVLTIALSLAISGVQLAGMADEEGGYDDELDGQLNHMASTLNVDQPDWSIFAPNPATSDRYHHFPAETENGELVDVYNGGEFSWERPYDRLNNQYGTYRERFYMNSVRRDAEVAAIYAEYLCENWEGEDGQQLTRISMWRVSEEITLGTIADPDDRDRSHLVSHRFGCGNNEGEILVSSPD